MNQEHKDLLIAAAKAAGIEVGWTTFHIRQSIGGTWEQKVGFARKTASANPFNEWNPITNLKDRYDLARGCGLRVDWKLSKVRGDTPASIYAFTPNDDESEALAILRAAVASKEGK